MGMYWAGNAAFGINAALAKVGRAVARGGSRLLRLKRDGNVKGASPVFNLPEKSDRVTASKEGFVVSLAVTGFLLHMPLTTAALALFTCTRLDDSGRTFLMDDVSIECADPNNIAWTFGIGVPTFALYSIGIPVGVAVVLWKSQAAAQRPDALRRYGFLFSGYRPSWYFWEAVIMARKAAFSVTTVFLAGSGLRMQVYATLVVALASLMFHVHARPYTSGKVNIMDEASLLVTIVTMICGLVLGDETAGEATRVLATSVTLLGNIGVLVCIAVYYVAARKRESVQGEAFRENVRRISIAAGLGLAAYEDWGVNPLMASSAMAHTNTAHTNTAHTNTDSRKTCSAARLHAPVPARAAKLVEGEAPEAEEASSSRDLTVSVAPAATSAPDPGSGTSSDDSVWDTSSLDSDDS
jgi:hypothetical protein